MMRPLGLYLAEFRPDGRVGGTLAAPGTQPILRDFDAEPAVALPALAEPAVEAVAIEPFEAADPIPDDDGSEAVALLPAPPAIDVAAALAAQAAEHEAALAAARLAWAAEEGDALATRFGEALAALETRLADALASLLEPFLNQALRTKALGQLHDALERLMSGTGETRPLTVSGPADLLAALQTRLGDRPGLAFVEAEAPDVVVALGDTRIRSQLRAFTRRLESALGEAA